MLLGSREQSTDEAGLPWASPLGSPAGRVDDQARIVDLREPLPHAQVIRVPSEHRPWHRYRVNLARMTCNCTQFKINAKLNGKRSPARWCRHLVTARLLQAGISNELARIIVLEREIPLYFRWISNDTVVGSLPNSDWHHVYVRAGDNSLRHQEYDRYCYNAAQERWVSGSPPREAEVLSAIDRWPCPG